MRVNGLNLRKSCKGATRVVFSGADLYQQGQPLRIQSRAGKAGRERIGRFPVTPQTQQATRAAQFPGVRKGAPRAGGEQSFIALKGILVQRCFEKQVYAGGFDFLTGLGKIGTQRRCKLPRATSASFA